MKEIADKFFEYENISFQLAVNSGTVVLTDPFRFQTPVSSILNEKSHNQ